MNGMASAPTPRDESDEKMSGQTLLPGDGVKGHERRNRCSGRWVSSHNGCVPEGGTKLTTSATNMYTYILFPSGWENRLA